MKNPSLFDSFFIGGFECSTHLSMEGHRLDVVAATQHDRFARQDYALCRAIGIKALRESARWPIFDIGGTLDLSYVRQLARIGREEGVTLIWDLMHYGYPDDLDPYSDAFVERFTAFARAVARVVREESEGEIWFTPINEISYTAWSAGGVGYMAPFGRGRAPEYKRSLVKASIEGINAIWDIDPHARILNVDPLIHLHAPPGREDLKPEADHFNDYVVSESFDMLCGRVAPELGGSRAHLGVPGFNYYSQNQWTISTPELSQRFLEWDDPGWVPLSDLLAGMHNRYGGPIVIAETGASAYRRPVWLDLLTREAQRAIEIGADLQGICLYPIISSPDWEDPTAFFDGGIFDISPQPDGSLKRVIYQNVSEALRRAQLALDPDNLPAGPLPYEIRGASHPARNFVRPLDTVQFKSDNFSYEALSVGEQLMLEVYGFEPGGLLPPHRHDTTEHVLTVLRGICTVRIEDVVVDLTEGESILVPVGQYHAINNFSTERVVVQQVSAPKPWDARFSAPHPSDFQDHSQDG